MTEEQTKKCNLMCLISILLVAVPFVVSIIYYVFLSGISSVEAIESYTSGEVHSIVTSVITCATWMCQIAGIVLMIIARVKYPSSKFAKVLMWVYISLAIIYVLFIILLVVLFVAFCSACMSGCPGFIMV